jgi:hypothetical protein
MYAKNAVQHFWLPEWYSVLRTIFLLYSVLVSTYDKTVVKGRCQRARAVPILASARWSARTRYLPIVPGTAPSGYLKLGSGPLAPTDIGIGNTKFSKNETIAGKHSDGCGLEYVSVNSPSWPTITV